MGKAGLAAATLSSWTVIVPCITPSALTAAASATARAPGGCTPA
jgi:hypothetical protein